jgi:RNA polymerase sigma-70 factor (ECF subfamily)
MSDDSVASSSATNVEQELEARAWEGDEAALGELFFLYRSRLRQVVDARLDRRLKGRVDPSDVLQESFMELARKLPSLREKSDEPTMSMFILMRLITTERVIVNHRRHIEAEGRDVRRETPQAQAAASSIFLAEHLLAVFGSAENKLMRQEMSNILQKTLEEMDLVDHEIITMRCFEGLTNAEAAEVLKMSENGASSRFVRAISRLKKQLESIPGFQ